MKSNSLCIIHAHPHVKYVLCQQEAYSVRDVTAPSRRAVRTGMSADVRLEVVEREGALADGATVQHAHAMTADAVDLRLQIALQLQQLLQRYASCPATTSTLQCNYIVFTT